MCGIEKDGGQGGSLKPECVRVSWTLGPVTCRLLVSNVLGYSVVEPNSRCRDSECLRECDGAKRGMAACLRVADAMRLSELPAACGGKLVQLRWERDNFWRSCRAREAVRGMVIVSDACWRAVVVFVARKC